MFASMTHTKRFQNNMATASLKKQSLRGTLSSSILIVSPGIIIILTIQVKYLVIRGLIRTLQ